MSLYNKKNVLYKKTVFGDTFQKKNSLKNLNENNNQVTIHKIIKNEIVNPLTEDVKETKEYSYEKTEKEDDNKNIDFQIPKRLSIEENNDIYSNNESGFLDNSSHKIDYSGMSERRIERFKSFASHNSFSTDRINDLFSNVDFRVQRTKTINNYNVSKFSEKEEEELDDEEKSTKIKNITNSMPILKENEFKDLKTLIEKYDKSYNEEINNQDSKEEITEFKKEITTTTRKEKKIINLGGEIIEKLNVSDSLNKTNNDNEIITESIEINNTINIFTIMISNFSF